MCALLNKTQTWFVGCLWILSIKQFFLLFAGKKDEITRRVLLVYYYILFEYGKVYHVYFGGDLEGLKLDI